jgi:hypothetical protein
LHKWYAALLDNDVPSITVEEGEVDDDVIKRLDNAEKTEIFDDKRVIGFWITDPASEQLDVLRIWGRVPIDILLRFQTREQMKPG